MDSLVARHDAMYSASFVDVATQVCFIDLQLTAPPETKKIMQLLVFEKLLNHPNQRLRILR